MVATMTPPRVTRPHPSVTKPHKVPIVVRPTKEELAQRRRERISAGLAVLMVAALIALLFWAAMSAEPSNADMMWDYPYLY